MKEFKDALRKIAAPDGELYSIVGKVTKVDKRRRVCTVSPINGDADLFGVRLQANESNTEGGIVYPKVDSFVIVTFTAQNAGFVSCFSTVEGFEFVAGQLKITATTEGVHLEKNGVDLKDIFEKMIDKSSKTLDFLLQLKVVTPTGLGTLSPEMVVPITQEKAELATLKQQISQLLT
jgi:hypothetical protein